MKLTGTWQLTNPEARCRFSVTLPALLLTTGRVWPWGKASPVPSQRQGLWCRSLSRPKSALNSARGGGAGARRCPAGTCTDPAAGPGERRGRRGRPVILTPFYSCPFSICRDSPASPPVPAPCPSPGTPGGWRGRGGGAAAAAPAGRGASGGSRTAPPRPPGPRSLPGPGDVEGGGGVSLPAALPAGPPPTGSRLHFADGGRIPPAPPPSITASLSPGHGSVLCPRGAPARVLPAGSGDPHGRSVREGSEGSPSVRAHARGTPRTPVTPDPLLGHSRNCRRRRPPGRARRRRRPARRRSPCAAPSPQRR